MDDSGEETRQSYVVKGNRSVVEVVFDRKAETGQRPVIRCSAPDGYGGLAGQAQGHEHEDQVLSLAGWMTTSTDGAFIAVLDAAVWPGGLVLVQADHDGRGSQTFYQSVHGDSPGVWLDFYFRAVFTAIKAADDTFSTPDLVLRHPTNGSWSQPLFTLSLEAIRHLADQTNLSVERIHIGCIHGIDTDRSFRQAVDHLENEIENGTAPEFRPFRIEERDLPNEVGSLSGARLFRIPLGRQRQPR
ncbi:MAG: hypothetical protein J0H98_04375 [Solirubrobacterales bacterium]|nr:hypothetical protein [Solirubrobacterales bacterium]